MTLPAQVQLTAPDAVQLAVEFVRQFSLEAEFFTSSEVCDAYKAAGLPDPEGGKGWRDKWGGVMTRSAKANYIAKAGKAAPGSATHMTSTVLWQSRLFKGERTVVETGKDQLEALRKGWVLNEFKDLRALLWKAYEIGFDQGRTGGKG